MPTNTTNEYYPIIADKIHEIKSQYQFLQNKADDYAFSALCIKHSIYKNPNYTFSESDLQSFIVDGTRDGGVDFMLTDPNSDGATDLIIGQAKYYKDINLETAKNAVHKMIDFYKDMRSSRYDGVRDDVVRRFIDVYEPIGEESTVRFVLYTSAKRNGIQNRFIKKVLTDSIDSFDIKCELNVYFAEDVVEEIKESESLRPTVEKGKLDIDKANNVLWFSDGNAAVVNISAKSLKTLYAKHGINLFAKNLRYYIKNADVDLGIKDTIDRDSKNFWYKNNGITIICDSFDIDGRELKLYNFSIVNGGQTTHLIYKNGPDDNKPDFFIVCKVISAQGTSREDKEQFSFNIAKATNSQKPIKPSDLKANAPEQIRFATEMKGCGIFYQTKRGESIDSNYRIEYKNSEISEVGKLSLAGIFQLPATSRNKPTSIYLPNYYDPTFKTNQKYVSGYIRDLLYVDYYFRKKFKSKFDSAHETCVTFAHNARTLCISFVALGARIIMKNIPNFKDIIQYAEKEDFYKNNLYPVLKNYNNLPYIIKPEVFNDKDTVDTYLYNLFERLIIEGQKIYKADRRSNESLNETNYLKKDKNYFIILNSCWDDFERVLNDNKGLYI